MGIKEIQAFLKPHLQEVESLMNVTLKSDVDLLDLTNSKLMEHPGKRLRPSLALLVAGACGTVCDSTYRYAAAAELLHNATLLHDDVVDGATQRRGVPTVAAMLNSPAAVLIGDYWLVKCLTLVLNAKREPERVLRIFSSTLGHLTKGELLQMDRASSAGTDESDYFQIIYGKTASLFEAAAMSAAISVEASEETIAAVADYARSLGMAFQIKDDIFDYTSPSDAIGKPVGIDLLEQKITLPLLCALDSVSAEESLSVRKKVKGIADNPALADEVHAFVMEHQGVEKAIVKMYDYVQEAISSLKNLPESKEKSYLVQLARFVADRNN